MSRWTSNGADRLHAGLVPLAIAAGLCVQVAVRLLLVHGRTGPLALPDEGGYLLDARLLSGGLPSDLSGWPLYRAGYALLITPVYLFTHDPHTIYRAVLTENAILNALVFPVTYLLARHVFDLSTRSALALGFGTALLPGVVFYGEWALSDAVLVLVVTGWLLLLGLWLRSASGRRGTAAGLGAMVLAAYADSVHSRGAVVVAVCGAVLLVAFWRRWAARGRIAVMAALLAAGTGAASWFNGWIAANNWPRGTYDLPRLLTDRLTSASGLGRTALITVGQLWSMGVATLGLGFVAMVGVGWWLRRREADRASRVVAVATVATVLLIAVASSAAGVDEHRVGNWAYGRYLACLAPALVVMSAATLTRLSRKSAGRLAVAAAATLAVAAVVVAVAAARQLHHDTFVPFDFPEVAPLTRSWSALHLPVASAVVLAMLAALVVAMVAAPRARWALPGLALAVVGVYADVANREQISQPWDAATFAYGRTFLAAAGVPAGSPVAIQACCWGSVAELQWEEAWGQPAFVAVQPGHPPPGYDVVIVATTPPTPVHWTGWHAAVRTELWTVWTRSASAG